MKKIVFRPNPAPPLVPRSIRYAGSLLSSRLFVLGLLLAGLLVIARPLYHMGIRSWQQWRAGEIWKSADRNPTMLVSGDPVGWIRSAKADLDTLVLLDGTLANLRRFPCWSIAGALPTQRGLKIIQGHRDAHFAGLGNLSPGDLVEMQNLDHEQAYRVSQIEIVPAEVLADHLMAAPDREAVVLVTCYPLRYAGPAPDRLLVWLTPQLPAPALVSL